MPYIDVPGDNPNPYFSDNVSLPDRVIRARIMARSANLVGVSDKLAVWCYGFLPGSDLANATGVCIARDFAGGGFLWVLATRRTGKVKATYRGYALDLPEAFRKVIEWTGTIH
jgi:hypothetical protein